MSRKTSPTAGRSGEMLSDIQPMYWNEVFQSGQLVGLNLAGFQAEGVMFQAAVTRAIVTPGHNLARGTRKQLTIWDAELAQAMISWDRRSPPQPEQSVASLTHTVRRPS